MLGKTKLHTIEVLISKALINSYISQDEFVSVNILKEYNEMKEKRKKSWNFCETQYLNMVGINRQRHRR